MIEKTHQLDRLEMRRMPGSRARQIHNLGFSREEIEQAAGSSQLLAMEIELAPACHLRCPHCGAPKRSSSRNELSQAELRDLVLQARDLGARKITLLGGGSAVSRDVSEMIRFVGSQDLELELFTDAAGITAGFARQLFEARVRVVLKVGAFDTGARDRFTGAEDSFELVFQALRELQEAGYPSEEASLTVAIVIGRHNIDQVLAIWRRFRDREIVPHLEIAAPQASGEDHEWLDVHRGEVQGLLAAIADVERNHYGQDWDPQPPLLGNGCMRHKFSCLVRRQGDVLACIGVDIPIGNIRDQKLHDIIKDSEILEDLRAHSRTIKEPCASCEEADSCYGCRGAAYELTGDYLAADPLCWRNAERQDEIAHLPFAAAELIPHERPMRMIDDLVRTGERTGAVSVTVSDEMPFVGENGIVDEIAYFEMMAQSVAALNGFKHLGGSKSSSEGYLVGAQNLEILGPARVGDALTVSLYKDVRFGNFAVLKGTVSRGDTILARGEIKTWHNGGSGAGPAGLEE